MLGVRPTLPHGAGAQRMAVKTAAVDNNHSRDAVWHGCSQSLDLRSLAMAGHPGPCSPTGQVAGCHVPATRKVYAEPQGSECSSPGRLVSPPMGAHSGQGAQVRAPLSPFAVSRD